MSAKKEVKKTQGKKKTPETEDKACSDDKSDNAVYVEHIMVKV